MNGAVKVVALFEALKGLVVLVAATGVLSLLHSDLYAAALSLVEHAHLNPAAKYPHIFLDAARHLNNGQLVLLAGCAMAYSALRFVEAYGLLRQRAWAEVLAACSGAIYVPFELLEFLDHPTLLHGALLLANVAVVVVMVRALLQHRERA